MQGSSPAQEAEQNTPAPTEAETQQNTPAAEAMQYQETRQNTPAGEAKQYQETQQNTPAATEAYAKLAPLSMQAERPLFALRPKINYFHNVFAQMRCSAVGDTRP